MSQPQQQIKLNPIQMLQITDAVLKEMKEWAEKKAEDPQGHKEWDVTAVRSLHHARLLCSNRMREIILEVQKAQEAQKKVSPGQHTAPAKVLGHSGAASLEQLWDQAGIHHYLDTGRP